MQVSVQVGNRSRAEKSQVNCQNNHVLTCLFSPSVDQEIELICNNHLSYLNSIYPSPLTSMRVLLQNSMQPCLYPKYLHPGKTGNVKKRPTWQTSQQFSITGLNRNFLLMKCTYKIYKHFVLESVLVSCCCKYYFSLNMTRFNAFALLYLVRFLTWKETCQHIGREPALFRPFTPSVSSKQENLASW